MLHSTFLTLITLLILWVAKSVYMYFKYRKASTKYFEYIESITESGLNREEQFLVMATSTVGILKYFSKMYVGKTTPRVVDSMYVGISFALNLAVSKGIVFPEPVTRLIVFINEVVKERTNNKGASITELHNKKLSSIVDMKAAAEAVDKFTAKPVGL